MNKFGQAIQTLVGDGDDAYIRFIVQKGKFADCALALLKQLNSVDLPTLGRPTMPHCKLMNLISYL